MEVKSRGRKVNKGDKNIYERLNLENLWLYACFRKVRIGKNLLSGTGKGLVGSNRKEANDK